MGDGAVELEGGEATADAPLLARLRELEAEVAHLRSVIRQAGDIIVATDGAGRVTEWNEGAEGLFGWARGEMLGRPAADLYVDKRAREKILEKLLATTDGVLREDVQVKTKSGERRWLGLTISWLKAADGSRAGTIGVGKDVTERRRLESELKKLTITDKLTGLYNQGHFFEQLEVEKERALRLGHTLSLLYFDLDGFKKLNDTRGHLEGDVVLRRIGSVIFESIRKEVDSGYRYGGDEFTILLPGADRANSVRFADRVRLRVQELDLGGVRLSMGVCEFDPKNRALQLVEKADQAMFLAKRSGGNRIAYYDPATDGPVLVERS